jgi:orotidine-5'-phosphate decarboxylase
VVGLDPRLELIPDFVVQPYRNLPAPEAVRGILSHFHRLIIDQVAGLVPAVKPQIAFFEQYGLGGLQAFSDAIDYARSRDLLVIGDAKRGDIGSTAEAYAKAFLGGAEVLGRKLAAFEVDCLTVSPYLGRDSLEPFLNACRDYGKGLFVLVKTSNRGSGDLQDLRLQDGGERLYERMARIVDEVGKGIMGINGYSSVGAVVGATYPGEAQAIRALMPRSFILVPGYGAQGGTGESAAICFNADSLGALVSASRSITFPHKSNDIAQQEFERLVRGRLNAMIADVRSALDARSRR